VKDHNSIEHAIERDTCSSRIFRVSVTLKGIDGALGIIGGLLLLLVPVQSINGIVRVLSQHELGDYATGRVLLTAVAGGSSSVQGCEFELVVGREGAVANGASR
jgi:uncharacterized membrane protein